MRTATEAPSAQIQDDIEILRERWTFLYRSRLPALARAKHDSQPKWPVTLDHCFARIILDNTVGADDPLSPSADSVSVRPWNTVISSPAVRNMSAAQLTAAISLAENIETGSVVLTELDSRSLQGRGKAGMSDRKGYTDKKRALDTTEPSKSLTTGPSPPTKKRATRKGEMADVWSAFRTSNNNETLSTSSPSARPDITTTTTTDTDMSAMHAKIRAAPNLTPFRKHVLLLLTQVPRGRYTTYKALAAAAAAHSAKDASSARAVGSAMRNNPFAPAVPCHRVLAADGRIGGFKGEWTGRGAAKGVAAEEGEFVTEKRALLKSEGVRFDGAGKVVGTPFVEFV